MAQNNARIIEQDIFVDVAATEAGSSAVIDLFGESGGASKYSLQAVYDVQAPAAKTFDSGVSQVDISGYQAKASTGAGDFIRVYDTNGSMWGIAADLTGSDPEPDTTRWTNIPVAQRAQVDLSSVLIITADDVATAFQDAFNALVGVTFVANDNTSSVEFTMNARGPAISPETYNFDASGPGSITTGILTNGIASEVDIVENSVSVPSHGFTTGFKVQLTTTGTLPAGLATATDYFLIVVDEDTLQFATSLANAQSGTEIDITNQGSSGAVNTITGVALAGASVTFQKSNNGTNWIDIQAATAIAADGSTMIEVPNVSYRYVKAVKALTSGQVDLKGLICVLGDST